MLRFDIKYFTIPVISERFNAAKIQYVLKLWPSMFYFSVGKRLKNISILK